MSGLRKHIFRLDGNITISTNATSREHATARARQFCPGAESLEYLGDVPAEVPMIAARDIDGPSKPIGRTILRSEPAPEPRQPGSGDYADAINAALSE